MSNKLNDLSEKQKELSLKLSKIYSKRITKIINDHFNDGDDLTQVSQHFFIPLIVTACNLTDQLAQNQEVPKEKIASIFINLYAKILFITDKKETESTH